MRCVHNPGAGQETGNERAAWSAGPMSRATSSSRGGGPAGLKAAEIAARRGHRVTLLEMATVLGGQVNLAARQPEHASIGEVTAYLEAAIADLGVTVRLGMSATAETIGALSPDIVIVATGSEPNLPGDLGEAVMSMALGRQVMADIEGLEHDFVVSGDQVLSGKRGLSGHVVVIDNNGHWEAAGTAEFLADAPLSVSTVIASHGMIGEDLEAGTRTLFQRRAAIKGITLLPGMSVVAIEPGCVRIAPVFSDADAIGWAKYILMPGEERRIEGVDWVVPVIGRRSREDLYLSLKQHADLRHRQIIRIGDCVAPRLIQSTILDAFEVARNL